jgi:dolichol-phosphate mannosyltransferase
MTLSIIIPLYNERATIIKVLERIFQLNLDLYVSEWDIIIVDDCSTDSVEQLIQEFLTENTNVKYFKHDKNQGKGSAIRTGVSHSK